MSRSRATALALPVVMALAAALVAAAAAPEPVPAGDGPTAAGCAMHAQHMHPAGDPPEAGDPAAEGPAAPATVQSAGQAAFGAIAEAVAVLDADPATDWSRVDLLALREHLVDMDRLMLAAAVVEQPVPGGFLATVTAEDARTRAAIGRMVPAHAAMLGAGAGGGPAATVRAIDGGVELTVTAADPADRAAVDRLRGLGFYGFMALGDHHRPHHLALARGRAMHGG